MKVLIATNNQSKFDVIMPLFKAALTKDDEFLRPIDLDMRLDIAETGSLQNRAKQKASAALQSLVTTSDASTIGLYIGSDDGIRIEKEMKTYAASKETTDRLLSGQDVNAGDAITIVRAFALLSPSGTSKSFITRVPMTYLGNPNNIHRQEGMYPLEYVLAYKDTSAPICTLDPLLVSELNNKYMLPAIKKALDQFESAD